MNKHSHFKDKNLICYDGLTSLEINTEGDVLPCCPDWHNHYKFGNIYKQSFSEIINSQKAKEFRKSLVNGSYKFCDKQICMASSVKKSDFCSYIDETGTLVHPLDIIRFAHDRTCNIRCITCRNDYVDTSGNLEKLNKLIYSHFLPMLNGIKIVHLNTNGELFASSHCKELISAIAERYPYIKFDITSNGILFNEENCKKLNLLNRMNNIGISLHAATKKTYNKITGSEGDKNYKQVIKNIEYLVKLKNKKQINELSIIFVVNYFNYKEMVKFARMPILRKNKVKIYFWEYRPWTSSNLSLDYDKMAVWNSNNNSYKKFKKIIMNKVFLSDNIYLPEIFIKIINDEKKRNIFYNFVNNLFQGNK